MTTYAVALTPDTTEILYMDYHVEKDGVEIDSGYGIPAEEIPGTNGRYKTSWDYTIPSDESAPGEYRIWVKIVCARKFAGLNKSSTTAVLGTETTQRVTFINSLMDFLNRVFFLNKKLSPLAVPPTPPAIPGPDKLKPTILAPSGAKSLQLGTFHAVVNLRVGCKELSFTIL